MQQSTNARAPLTQPMAQYVGRIALLGIVIAIGYLAFRQLAIAVMPQLETYNLYILAIIAGVASFFSPCAFPLLPSYFSFFSTQDQTAKQDKLATHLQSRTLQLGLIAAGGVITFNLILGALIGWLGANLGTTLSMTSPNPHPFVLWLRSIVGLLLIILGFLQWFGYNLKPGVIDQFAWFTRPKREGSRSAVWSLYLYGLGYNAAGMGCTAPILAGLMVFALTNGGFTAVMTAFLIFSLTMGSLMLIISILVARSHDTFIRQLKASTSTVKRLSSVLLIGVGVFSLFTVFNRATFMTWFFPGVNANAMVAGVSMDYAPPVRGLYEGDEVIFIHTEASDPEVAQRLTEMMGPTVIHAPQLADTPDALLGTVYVFTNGIAGNGPFGFQADVFDSIPGDENYSPLRAITLVTWQSAIQARQLDSRAEIEAAAKAGEISLAQSEIVVNMPILRWPTGTR